MARIARPAFTSIEVIIDHPEIRGRFLASLEMANNKWMGRSKRGAMANAIAPPARLDADCGTIQVVAWIEAPGLATRELNIEIYR
jgi:hypothetical protein